jgi:addiction module HigA family antidote
MLQLRTIHPGEVLQSEFLAPLGLDTSDLAGLIGVPQSVIDELVAGKRRLCVDLAILLTEHLAMGERFWLGLQMDHDLEIAQRARARAAGEANSGMSAYPQTWGEVCG